MADLIDQEALLDEFRWLRDQMPKCSKNEINDTIERIKKAPAVDAEPVQHGRWIGRPLCGNDDCRCSNCGYWENVHASIRGEITQKYCPNCGARMGMEEEE